MSEVKVRITAQNETQTGFQSVLSDAKKTASEVKRTFSQATTAPRAMQPQQAAGGGKPFSFEDFYDDAIKKAEQQIEANLAKRKQAREAAAQAEKAANADSGNSIMGLAGRFAMLAGVAVTVGKVISLAFQEVSNAFKQAAEISKQLGPALQQAGSAMSSGGSTAGFKQLNALADQLERTRKETFGDNFGEALANAAQGRPGQLGARLADTALSPFGMSGSAELTAQAEQARRQAREMLIGSLARQATNADAMLGAGGNPEAIRRMQTEQQNAAEIDQARQALDPTGNGNESAERAIALIKERQAAEARLEQQIKSRAAADAAAAMREQNAESGMTSEQRLAKEQAALASLDAEAQKSGRYTNEAALEREKTLGRIAALEKSITAENERQIAAQNAVSARAADMRAANAETAATQGMSDSELLAREQGKLAKLDEEAMGAGRYSNEAMIEREAITQRILALEGRIAATREGVIKGIEEQIADREFTGMSPAEQQAELDAQLAAFDARVASGALSPEQAAQQAARLIQMSDSINGQQGFQGSQGASAFQRIGFASNEFFDTRKAKDPAAETAKAVGVLKEIKRILDSGQPLVLANTNS